MMAADVQDVEDSPEVARRRWQEEFREIERILAEEKRCCYCGMTGHLSKDCKQPRNDNAFWVI
jgi:hypothetical protein